MVERQLPKLKVAGSSPVSRSRLPLKADCVLTKTQDYVSVLPKGGVFVLCIIIVRKFCAYDEKIGGLFADE